MIVEQFGGLITCKSKWGQGTSFIFLIALDNSEDTAKEANLRFRNTIKKVYMRIKVKEYNDDKFYDIFEENSFKPKNQNFISGEDLYWSSTQAPYDSSGSS
jgi:hypothetical protein